MSDKSRGPRLIGVIHLPPLPGSPGAMGEAPDDAIIQAGEWALRELSIFQDAGFDAVILENFGDAPFYGDRVPPETIAAMSVIAAALTQGAGIRLGINVLRNDSRAALAIASVVGMGFIRVNVLSGVVATDQGLIQGDAAFLAREKVRLGSSLSILADVQVKHATTLHSSDRARAILDVSRRALADGVIVSGDGTGEKPDFEILAQDLSRLPGDFLKSGPPLWIGSGISVSDLSDLASHPVLRKGIYGVIVSSSLRRHGQPGHLLEESKCREFAAEFKRFQAIGKKPLAKKIFKKEKRKKKRA